ncbi:MAG: rRNA maturation RNase YbeY [Planctomycetes bacterium]|nr:rRNA maturation RNase YbeY [Planctomycetota bacterium]
MARGRILVADEQSALRLPVSRLKALARGVLEGEKLWPATLSLAFVDNAAIRRVNRRFLKHDYATDVLSFLLSGAEEPWFGEVVISTEYAVWEAARRGLPALEEVARYVAHGILHLAGYDDAPAAKKRVMWSRQERYVTKYFENYL